jgi:hypothetical protein
VCQDYDPPELYSETQRTARKEHRCEECWRMIAAGEQYWYASGKAEGEFFDAKTCAHCHRAAEWLIKECRGYLHGGVLEDLKDHRYNGYPFAKAMGLCRLIVGMGRDWKRFNGTGLMALPRAVA